MRPVCRFSHAQDNQQFNEACSGSRAVFSILISTAGKWIVGPGVRVAGVETLVQQTARVVLLVDVTILCRPERSVGERFSLAEIYGPQTHTR